MMVPGSFDQANNMLDLVQSIDPEFHGLQQSRQKDLITARSNYGPHKDDLKFIMEGQPLKSIGSQGQQKSFLVALKLVPGVPA